MRTLIGIATLGLVLGVAPTADAQTPSFWLGAGLTMPTSDYGDFASTGFHGMGAVSLGLGTGALGVRVEGVYHRTGLEQGVDGNTSILGAMASLMYSVPSPGTVKPYLIAGAGYYKANVEVTGFGSADESDLGFGGGGGIQFAMGGTTLFAEVRYITVGGDVQADFLPITVGIKLGGK
ncbi:MAG: outer membrane beta-barrel protein [Tepidiformaceae bacterium]